MEYLTASNKIGLGDEVAGFASGALNAKGKRVVVVGGGDTAMDCVRTAVRQGAKSVTCLYRRDRDNMPGSRTEVRHAEEEGVVFEWLAAPGDIKVERGKVKAMGAERMRLGRPDADGRRAPEKVDQGGFELSADMVIKALGFEPENLPTAFSAADLGVRGDGTIVTDRKDMSTSIEGVFAAGDIVRGASLVVWAIKEGGDAAEGIHAYLKTRAHAARIAAE
jgi:glutamate synthase (NADPH/NADH) small chain